MSVAIVAPANQKRGDCRAPMRPKLDVAVAQQLLSGGLAGTGWRPLGARRWKPYMAGARKNLDSRVGQHKSALGHKVAQRLNGIQCGRCPKPGGHAIASKERN